MTRGFQPGNRVRFPDGLYCKLIKHKLKVFMIRKKALILSSLLVLALPASPALARNASDGADDAINDKTTIQTDKSDINKTTSLTSTDDKTKKTATKLKVCQNRQNAIKKQLENMAKRGGKQLAVFDTVAIRTEKFYADKNLSAANYAGQVANVNAKKIAAADTIQKIKSDAAAFSCDQTDPKASLQSFKGDLKAQTAALQAYRTSVKDLIKTVKTALAAEGENEAR